MSYQVLAKQIDNKSGIVNFAAQATNQLHGGVNGAAGRQQVINGFVPVRKPRKLPRETIAESYELEYGTDQLEIHVDAIKKGDKVPPRFGPHHFGDAGVFITLGQQFNAKRIGFRVFQQAGGVTPFQSGINL
jgi:hypothetical protein